MKSDLNEWLRGVTVQHVAFKMSAAAIVAAFRDAAAEIERLEEFERKYSELVHERALDSFQSSKNLVNAALAGRGEEPFFKVEGDK